MGIFSRSIAIDLGTAYSVVAREGDEAFWRVASSVAVASEDRRPIAFGDAAKAMLGKTHAAFEVLRPLRDGVIADYAATTHYLESLLDEALKTGPAALTYDIFLCVPWGATAVELRSYIHSLRRRRCRVHLIREPFAAALGAGHDILSEDTVSIVDMGGGTTEIASISNGYMLQASSLRRGGNFCDETIQDALRLHRCFEVGLQTAEDLKKRHASVWPVDEDYEFEVRGSARSSHLPDHLTLSTAELRSYLEVYALSVENTLRDHLRRLSREAQSVVQNGGLTLAGGTSSLRGWKERLEHRLGIPVKLSSCPELCVIRGMKKVMGSPKIYRGILRISEAVSL